MDVTSAYSNSTTFAAASGIVYRRFTGCIAGNTSCGSGFGNHIVISHPSGLYTLYAHLESANTSVSWPNSVSAGQAIAVMGATGNVTGVHIHFEVLNYGQEIVVTLRRLVLPAVLAWALAILADIRRMTGLVQVI